MIKVEPKINFEIISDLCLSRPKGNLLLEQYLMTSESVYCQLEKCRDLFQNKDVLFLGDDDHISLLMSYFFNTRSTVLELDSRVIKNQILWEKTLKLDNHIIIKSDFKDPIKSLLKDKFDIFYANPPYGSKNKGLGALVWLSRGLSLLKKEGFGLLVYPIRFDFYWSLTNMNKIQNFLTKNDSIIVGVDHDLHTYQSLKKDPNLRSSNILFYYLGEKDNQLESFSEVKNLYR